MFCRSMERGEWARRLLKEDGEEVVEVGGEDDEADCGAILAWFCGAVSDRDSECVSIASAIICLLEAWSICERISDSVLATSFRRMLGE